jgi:hypothetical protein
MIEREARSILADEGCSKVNRAVVEAGRPGDAPWTIRIVPTEPLGRVAKWMHVHLFYGLAFAALLGMHSGNPFGSGMGMLLAGLGYLVFATGLVGIVLWALGPRWLTRRERDLSIEEAFSLSESLERKRKAALKELDEQSRSDFQEVILSRGRNAMLAEQNLGRLIRRLPDSSSEYRDLMALVIQEQVVKTELGALRRVRMSFMAWKLVHIPAAVILIGLVVVHVVSVWKY